MQSHQRNNEDGAEEVQVTEELAGVVQDRVSDLVTDDYAQLKVKTSKIFWFLF
jgi:hypothetical protein